MFRDILSVLPIFRNTLSFSKMYMSLPILVYQKVYALPVKSWGVLPTVLTINSCTSRPGAWQCLVAQTPIAIVCLTQVWQSLFPFFCDKTFVFAIQTWQTTLEHYYVYVQTYFLSQHRKMLILLISSCCKMCTLSTLRSRAFVCCKQYKHARSYRWQWPSFTMGSNE